jgi:uncharacterized protein involved in exopolysaccharide biosynthesis
VVLAAAITAAGALPAADEPSQAQAPNAAGNAAPAPLDEREQIEFAAMVRGLMDADLAEANARIAALEAKLAAVEQLLAKAAKERGAQIRKQLTDFQDTRVGKSGCGLNFEGQWISQSGEPCVARNEH